MTNETKWCELCQRYVVPKKEFNSIGWVGLVAAVSVVVASLFNEPLARSLATNTLAAGLMTGVGNILLYVILLLVAPLFLISVVYCIYYRRKQPHCPICNSQNLTERTSSVSTAYMGEKGLELVGDSPAETPTPIETPSKQSLTPQWPSLNLQLPSLNLQRPKDPLILFLSIIAIISVIVLLILYALFSGRINI
jgi:uncharacterized membrane protein